MRKLAISVLVFSLFSTTYLLAREELLLKIPENSNQQLRILSERYGVKLRYRTSDLSIIQVSRSALPALPSADILDVVLPDFNYYLLRVNTASEAEKYGEVIDKLGGLFLVKLLGLLEASLLDLPGHNRARLPVKVSTPEFDQPSFALSVATLPQQRVTVQTLLQRVDVDRWFDQIKTLVENENLDHPGQFFSSRYSLRVRDAVQFDDASRPDHACDNAADYIAEQFRSYGLEVEFDSFLHRRRSALGRLLGEYVMRNVIATLPGKGPNQDRIYLMTGHYDSIASKTLGWEEDWRTLPAPGASDNASGIAQILETARLLSQQDFNSTIRFIAFSGEELFLFGSKHYSKLVAERGDRIAGVLNFDLLGHDEDGVLDIHVLGDEQSQWLVNVFGTTAERYNIEVDLRKRNDSSFIFSDHSPFWEIGIPAVMVAEESTFGAPESTDYIHSEADTLERITRPLGALALQLAVATLAELAGPIPAPGEPGGGTPDILWEPAEVSVSQPVASKGEEVKITATARNSGSVGVEEITIQFVVVRPDGTTMLISEQTTDLDAGQSQTFLTTFTPAALGLFTLRAIVNNDARAFESNFGNNQIETEVTVTDSGLKIDDIVAYPNPINFGTADKAVKLSYVLNRDADVIVALYTPFGEKIFEQKFQPGSNGGRLGMNDRFMWGGKNMYGRRISDGVYVCQIYAMDSNGASEKGDIKVAVISE